MNASYINKLLLPALIFLFSFVVIPLHQLDNMSLMPGNTTDPRLNHFFLENIYQFIIGRSESLWQLPFFYPFPYVIGFSDNLFGSSPIYVFARGLSISSFTSFQIWFLVGYAANFVSSYYVLRKFNFSSIASTIGALIFAFSLPTTAHAFHAQLHYRAGIPLAVYYFLEFLMRKDFKLIIISFFWLVFQFYCGIYMGFFTILLLSGIFIAYLIYTKFIKKIGLNQQIREIGENYKALSGHSKLWLLSALIILLAMMAVLFFPYFQVSRLYGAKRLWSEIEPMLPRPYSYFLADNSLIWASLSALIHDIPNRSEHQMFMGLAPMALMIFGFIISFRRGNGFINFCLFASMLFLVIITLLPIKIKDDYAISAWLLIYKLPLASAIRCLTRIDQVLLFSSAYFSALSVDYLRSKFVSHKFNIVIISLLGFLIFEDGATKMQTSPKKEWEERLQIANALVPGDLKEGSIIFLAQKQKNKENTVFYIDDLDAMWVALNRKYKTMNGFSGLFPPGFSLDYLSDCTELPRRIYSFAKFSRSANDLSIYQPLMREVTPIGFEGCQSAWLIAPPKIDKNYQYRQYTADDFHKISLSLFEYEENESRILLRIKIINNGNYSLLAKNDTNTSIKLSWRFLDDGKKPLSDWVARINLPKEIPANDAGIIDLNINKPIAQTNRNIEISIVQENVFWGHNIGMLPLLVPLK